jgi:hypothetical protein
MVQPYIFYQRILLFHFLVFLLLIQHKKIKISSFSIKFSYLFYRTDKIIKKNGLTITPNII